MWILNSLISVTFDDKDKRILLIIFLAILLLLLLLGGLNRLLNSYLEHSAKKIDPIIAGYTKYELVLNEKEMKKLGRKKAHLMFVKEATIPLIVMIIIFVIFLVYCGVCNVNWTYIFEVYDDIILELDAETTIWFGLEIWSDWPTIVEGSIVVHNDFEGYIAYALFISFTIGTFWYLFAALRMDARIKRVDKKAKEKFTETLEEEDKEEKKEEKKEETK